MMGDDINSFDRARVVRSDRPLHAGPGRKLPGCDQRPDPIGNLQMRAARLDDLDRHQKQWHHILSQVESKA